MISYVISVAVILGMFNSLIKFQFKNTWMLHKAIIKKTNVLVSIWGFSISIQFCYAFKVSLFFLSFKCIITTKYGFKLLLNTDCFLNSLLWKRFKSIHRKYLCKCVKYIRVCVCVLICETDMLDLYQYFGGRWYPSLSSRGHCMTLQRQSLHCVGDCIIGLNIPEQWDNFQGELQTRSGTRTRGRPSFQQTQWEGIRLWHYLGATGFGVCIGRYW